MNIENYFTPSELFSVVKAGYAHLEEASPAKEQPDVVMNVTSSTTVKFTLKSMNFMNMTVKFGKPKSHLPELPVFVTFNGDNAFSFNHLNAISQIQKIAGRHFDEHMENSPAITRNYKSA